MEGAVDTGAGGVAAKDPGGSGELRTPCEELGAVLPVELAPAHAVGRKPSAIQLTAPVTGLSIRIRRTAPSRLRDDQGQSAADAIVVVPRQANPSSTHLRCSTPQPGSRVSDTVGHQWQVDLVNIRICR
jgi:hypothetical protein